MPLLADRVQESTSTIGTGTLTLSGAVTGYRTFNASFTNGDVVYYTIDDGAGNWEVGYGTVGTGTLTRTVVLESSNANALVSFASGVKRVFNTATAVSILNASTGGTVNGALTVTGTTTLATSLTGILQAISGAVSTITIGSGLTFAAGTLTSTGSGGTVTSVSGTGTVSGLTLSGTVTTSGSLTLGGTLNLSSPPAIGATAANTGAFTTLTASLDSSFTSTGALLISKGTTGQQPGSPVTGMIRYNTTSNQFEGYAGASPSWLPVGGSVISNDTTTATNLYPIFANATSGTATTVYTGNANLLYRPSTGELQAQELIAANGLVVNSATVSVNYSIPSGSNAISAGPVSVNSGIVVTVSSGSVWVIA